MRKLSFSIGFTASFFLAATARAENPNDYKPKFGGQVEAWYKADNSEMAPGGGSSPNNTFRIRRSRLTASGNITDDLTYRFQAAFEPSSTDSGANLLDTFFEYKAMPWLRLGMGQYKYFVTMEGTEGTMQLPFVLRADSVNQIVASLGSLGGTYRDIGVFYKVTFPEKLGLAVNGGVMNGNGGRGVTQDNNDSKDYWGKIDINPLQGLVLGVSGSKGRGENRADKVEKDESVYGAHAEYRFSSIVGLRLRSEFVGSHLTNVSTTTVPSTSKQAYGYYVAAIYRLPSMAPSTEPNAGWEFAYRWERFNTDRNFTAPAWVTNHTLGATYRFHNDNRFRLNYVFRSADSAVASGGRNVQEQASGLANGSRLGGLFLAQYIVSF